MSLAGIHRMTGLCRLILPQDAAVGKPEPSSWGLLGIKVGDRSAFCARNVDFAFVWTCLSPVFRASAWIKEPLMPAICACTPAAGSNCIKSGRLVRGHSAHAMASSSCSTESGGANSRAQSGPTLD